MPPSDNSRWTSQLPFAAQTIITETELQEGIPPFQNFTLDCFESVLIVPIPTI